MSYLPLTEDDRQEMFAQIGVASFEDLISDIPGKIRANRLDLPKAMSELELKEYFEGILKKNETIATLNSFLGAGSYDHYIPSVVRHMLSRGEFYTAYTPYQPEASQGTLQTIFEYQSLISELTGMDIANASHYDGATSFAESCLMCLRKTDRKNVLIAKALHPDYRKVLKTYLEGTEFEVLEIPFDETGRLDQRALKEALSDDVGCLAIGSPNFFGLIEESTELVAQAHAAGALVVTVGHPLSYMVFQSPGEIGADIACGDAQPLGLPVSYGGPYVGYIAVKNALLRQMPGRLAGLTRDKFGRRAYALTLQAREQHIRREKASSNICTNQALCALAVTVHMTALGPEGLKDAAWMNLNRMNFLKKQLKKLQKVKVHFSETAFNEFVIKVDGDVDSLLSHCRRRGVLAGYPLKYDYPELKQDLLVTVTETKSEGQILAWVRAVEEWVS